MMNCLDWPTKVLNARLVDGLECWTPSRVLVRVDPCDYDSAKRLDAVINGLGPHNRIEFITTDSSSIVARLTSGITVFGFLVFKYGYWSKQLPPALDEDRFIELSWNRRPSDVEVRASIDAALFELSAAAQIDLRRSPRPLEITEDDDIGVPKRQLEGGNLRLGVIDVLSLYNSAISQPHGEYRLLAFAKVLEHVSECALSVALARRLQAGLLGGSLVRALVPLLARHRKMRSDEAIKETVLICCSAPQLHMLAPASVRSGSSALGASESEAHAFLRRFSDCLVATRNKIAHAKASYRPTGNECPDDELGPLTECAQIAAKQVIRWYSQDPLAIEYRELQA